MCASERERVRECVKMKECASVCLRERVRVRESVCVWVCVCKESEKEKCAKIKRSCHKL